MPRTLSRDPIPARFISDVQPHTLILKVYARTAIGADPPAKNVLENVAAEALLDLPRLDTGSAWDVSSVAIPDSDTLKQLLELARQVKFRLDEVFALMPSQHEQLVVNAQDALFVLTESMKEGLGLEDQCES